MVKADWKKWNFRWRLKVDRVSIEGMCAGREFRVEGADTEKASEEKLLVIHQGSRSFAYNLPYYPESVCQILQPTTGKFLLLFKHKVAELSAWQVLQYYNLTGCFYLCGILTK